DERSTRSWYIIKRPLSTDSGVHQCVVTAIRIEQTPLQRFYPAVHSRYTVPERHDDFGRLTGKHLDLIHPGNRFIKVVLFHISFPPGWGQLSVRRMISRVAYRIFLDHIAVHDLGCIVERSEERRVGREWSLGRWGSG